MTSQPLAAKTLLLAASLRNRVLSPSQPIWRRSVHNPSSASKLVTSSLTATITATTLEVKCTSVFAVLQSKYPHLHSFWTWTRWEKKSWKPWVLDCAAYILENLPDDVLNDPKGLTDATIGVIDKYCKLLPSLDTLTQELDFYGDMLTTRYWSPIWFFTFITLNAPICSAESVKRHESLRETLLLIPQHGKIAFVSTQHKTNHRNMLKIK